MQTVDASHLCYRAYKGLFGKICLGKVKDIYFVAKFHLYKFFIALEIKKLEAIKNIQLISKKVKSILILLNKNCVAYTYLTARSLLIKKQMNKY